MFRKLFVILLSAALLLSAFAFAEDASPQTVDIGRVWWPLTQLKEYAENLPEGTVMTGEFSYKGKFFSVAAEELNLDTVSGPVKAEDLECMIAFMPNLKKIIAKWHPELSNAVMIPLVEKYPDVFFVWALRINKYKIYTDVTAFSTMSTDSDARFLKSKDCELFKYLPNLRALDLGHHDITDISFVRYMPELRILILADNNIKDITPIGELKHLEYLELFMNYYITDLSPLANCTELLDLNLSYLKFTSLQPLESYTKLERLWDAGAKVSTEEREAFQASHPDCEVLFRPRGSSTYGTWRSHPRYAQYRKMFETGVWKEFTTD